jgi:arginyl-tRNA synthetase
LAESSPQNTINFDLDLAKKTGRENPAFYIQYAHARCCAILRKALEPSTNSESGEIEQPPISAQQWQEFLQEYKDDKQGKVFTALFDSDAVIAGHQKALIARLETFPSEVEEAVQARNPGRIARFAYDLANDLQKFYEVSRVITDDLSVSKARLGLIFATKQVLANALGIIGVSAPERM